MRCISWLGIASFVSLALASCGGKVGDPLTNSEPGPTPTPEPVPTTAPTTPTNPVGPGVPTKPPTPTAGPLPTGMIVACGLLEGDNETNLLADGQARALGIYSVVAIVDECSGAGGLHMTLVRKSGCATSNTVHFGAHACYPKGSFAAGDLIMVGVAPEPGSVNNPGWCLDDVAPWDGVARAIRRVAPGENETQLLAKFGCIP